jgi:signal transduction histidine kinase
LVEDDEDDMVLTRQLLREIEPDAYDLDWTSDFQEGLDRLSQAGYDVCLVDYCLGVRNGVEFLKEAAERGIGAPIILLTGQGDRAVDVAAMNAGAADYLNKAQLSSSVLERAIRYSIQQKKAEQQRIRLYMEQAARAEAVAENRAKDEFLAVLSHELRTPLTAVLLSASALEQEEPLPEKARDLVCVIRRNVELEARLIDDLLDLTRVTRGKLELRREVVDLHEQIQYAIRSCCDSDVHEKRLSVNLAFEASQFHVWGDPARLQQVLWNLIKNAVKFTPPGGNIHIRTSNPSAGRLSVEIQDTGIGIRAEALPRIFNAFEQADRSITRRFGGLGLGLAICKALMQLHGGSITAQSAGAECGSTFRLELPITTVQSHSAGPVRDGSTAARNPGISILLVEDHADTASLMQRLLRHRGYTVRIATNVADALRSAETGDFQILISDIGLPDGNGLDLMRQLRVKRPLQGIALSGFGMEEDVERSHAAGFAEHLTKPVNMAQLEAAIERVLQAAPGSATIANARCL